MGRRVEGSFVGMEGRRRRNMSNEQRTFSSIHPAAYQMPSKMFHVRNSASALSTSSPHRYEVVTKYFPRCREKLQPQRTRQSVDSLRKARQAQAQMVFPFAMAPATNQPPHLLLSTTSLGHYSTRTNLELQYSTKYSTYICVCICMSSFSGPPQTSGEAAETADLAQHLGAGTAPPSTRHKT